MMDPRILQEIKDVQVTEVVHENDLVARLDLGFSTPSAAGANRSRWWWWWCWSWSWWRWWDNISTMFWSHRLESYCSVEEGLKNMFV
jgi:hypothetical protein